MFHWVCTECWGTVHECKTIGGILPSVCAACQKPLMLRERHPVEDEELAEIKARLLAMDDVPDEPEAFPGAVFPLEEYES